MSGQTQTVTEPSTTAERDLAEPCERRHCTNEVFADALVTVQVGDVSQQWCPGCVEEEFGLSYGEYKNGFSRYLTAKTAWAFVIGASLASLLFVLFAL